MSSREDEYARRYMGGESVRFLDKVRIPAWMHALLLGTGAVGVGATLAAGAPLLVPLAAGGATILSWAMLAAIRVAVTSSHVHVQYGLFGPKIAFDDIVSLEVVDYSLWKYGGWGIRLGFDGSRAFSVPGRGGKALRIQHKSRLGTRILDVTSEQPAALKAAIEEAMGARAGRDLDAARAAQGLAAAPSCEAREESVAMEQTVEEER